MERNEMEGTSQSLSLESFSYRWLVDLKPSTGSRGNSLRASFDVSDEGSFIEMDPGSTSSRRFMVIKMKSNSQDFRFNFPMPEALDSLAPADELFAEGFVLPLFADPSDMKTHEYSDLKPEHFSTKHAVRGAGSKPKAKCSRKQKRRWPVSTRLFCKYLGFLRPVYRLIVRGDARRAPPTKNSVYPSHDSPKTSCSDEWRYSSVDSESSIYEAVLHCKRSIGR
ncbi:hypothetical protein SAY87_017487 [Trapa incisa]|uniref:Membrane-associated kinase regulator 6 n=1 Tax=Trapa incisa TaxID=236973 RepID=A0AAN7L2I8_9MYRT|nr:hypothetical protein SAY87_017487 [Trapa incisa]